MPGVQFDAEIITDQSALDTVGLFGEGKPYFYGQYKEIGGYVVFSAGCSAGIVVLETAPDFDYTGIWANLATINFASPSKAHQVAITGVFRAARFRISSAIIGGTVKVRALAIS